MTTIKQKVKIVGKNGKINREIWIRELLSGRLDRHKFNYKRLCKMIGYVYPDEERTVLWSKTITIGKWEHTFEILGPNRRVWSVPLLGGGEFSCRRQEEAEIIAQNETIIALLLSKERKL